MDKELQEIIDAARQAGYTDEEIQSLIDGYNSGDFDVDTTSEEPTELDNIVRYAREEGMSDEDIELIKARYEADSSPIEEIIPEDETILRDSEGERSNLPEGWQWVEETAIGDFFQDIFNAGRNGLATREMISATDEIIDGDYTEEELKRFIKASNASQNAEQSNEMKAFNKMKEECGGGAWCTMKALAKYPSVATQIMSRSLVSMTSFEALGSATLVGGGVAATGVGLPFALPAAIGTLSAYTEGMTSFNEFLREELGNKAFNEENVSAILKDPEAMSRIRGRAAARGIAIGVVDGITAGVASKIGTSVAKSAAKTIGKGKARALGTISVGATESLGGAAGEYAGQLASGQEIDTGEILLEGIAEVGGPGTITGTVNVINQARQDVLDGKTGEIGTYVLNGQTVTKDELNAGIESMDDSQLADSNIEVQDDNATKDRVAVEKKLAEIRQDLRNSSEDITEEQVQKIAPLQAKLDTLDGKTNEVAKETKKSLKEQIDAIINPEEVVEETPKVETPKVETKEVKTETPKNEITEQQEIEGANQALKNIKSNDKSNNVLQSDRRVSETGIKNEGKPSVKSDGRKGKSSLPSSEKATIGFSKYRAKGTSPNNYQGRVYKQGELEYGIVEQAKFDKSRLNNTDEYTFGKGRLKGLALPPGVTQIDGSKNDIIVNGKKSDKATKSLRDAVNVFPDVPILVDETMSPKDKAQIDFFSKSGKRHAAIRINPKNSNADVLSEAIEHESFGHLAVFSLLNSKPEVAKKLFKAMEAHSGEGMEILQKIRRNEAYKNETEARKEAEKLGHFISSVLKNKTPRYAQIRELIKQILNEFLDMINRSNLQQKLTDARSEQLVIDFYNSIKNGNLEVSVDEGIQGVKKFYADANKGDSSFRFAADDGFTQIEDLNSRVTKGDLNQEQQKFAEEFVNVLNEDTQFIEGELDKINEIKVDKYESKAPDVKSKAKRKGKTKRRESIKKASKNFDSWKNGVKRWNMRAAALKDMDTKEVMSKLGVSLGEILYSEDLSYPSVAGRLGARIHEGKPESYFEAMLEKDRPRLEKLLAEQKSKKKPSPKDIAATEAMMTVNGQRAMANAKVGGIVFNSIVGDIADFTPTKLEGSEHSTNMLRILDRVALSEFVEEATEYKPKDNTFKTSFMLDENDIPNIESEDFNAEKSVPGYKIVKGANGNKKVTSIAKKASDQVYYRYDNMHNTLLNLQEEGHEIFGSEPELDVVEGLNAFEKFKAEKGNQKKVESEKSKSLSKTIAMNMAKQHGGERGFKQLRTFVTNGRELNNVPYFTVHGPMVSRSQIHMTGEKLGPIGVKNLILQLVDNYKPANENLSTEREQLEWGLKQLPKWAKWSADPIKNRGWMDAKEQELFLGLLHVLNEGLNTEGGIQNLDTGALGFIDMTSAGPQAMAMITRNDFEAKLVNLSNAKDRYDLYSIVGNEIKRRIELTGANWEALTNLSSLIDSFDVAVREIRTEKFEMIDKLKKEKKKLSQEENAEFESRIGEVLDAKKEARNTLEESGVVDAAGRAFFEQIESDTDFRKFLKNLVMTTNYAARPVKSAKRYMAAYGSVIADAKWDTMYWTVKEVFAETNTILADQSKLKTALQKGTRMANKKGKPFKIKSRYDGLTYNGIKYDYVSTDIEVPYSGWMNRDKIGVQAGLGQGPVNKTAGANAVTAVFAQMGESQVIRYMYDNFPHPQSHVHDALGTTLSRMDEIKLEARIAYVKNAELVDGKDWLTDTLHSNLPENVASQLDESVPRGTFNNNEALSNQYTVSTGWGGITELKPSERPETGANEVLKDTQDSFSFSTDDSTVNDMESILDGAIKITEGKGNYNLYNAFKHAHTDFIAKNPQSEVTIADVIDYFIPKLPDAYASKLKEHRSHKAEALKVGEDGVIKASKEIKGKASILGGKLGKSLAREFQSIPILLENAFKGTKAAALIKKLSGFSRFEQGKALAKKLIDSFKKEYNDKFLKTKPNGKDFNSAENTFERSIYSLFNRKPIDPKEATEDFKRKKKLVEESLKNYANSGETRYVEMGKLYQKVWDSKFKNAESFSDIMLATHQTNKDASKFWVDKWKGNLAKLKDISKKYFKQEITDDVNFSAESFINLEDVTAEFNVGQSESFMPNLEGSIDTKVEGSTIVENKPTELNGQAYNFEFDYIQQTRLYKSLLTEHTAEASHVMKGFFESPRFYSLFKNRKDANLVKERVAHYQRKSRGSLFYDKSTPEARGLMKAAQKLNKLFYAYVLAGPSQVIMQTVPLIMGTAILNNGRVNFLNMLKAFSSDSDVSKFAEKANSFVQHRGLSGENTQTAFAHQSKLNEGFAKKNFNKLVDGIDWLADKKLQYTIALGDGAVTKWALFENYKQALRKRGLQYDPNAEINEDALIEADQMVSKHHNVSDSDLKGMIYTSDKTAIRLIKSTLLQFTDFAFNLKSKIVSDFSVATSKATSSQDRSQAIKGLIHSAAEIAVYNYLASQLSSMVYEFVLRNIFDEDDEDKIKKMMKKHHEQYMKTVRGNIVRDLIPIPFVDNIAAPYLIEMYANAVGIDKQLAWKPMAKDWYEQLGFISNADKMFLDSGYSSLIDNIQGEMYKEMYGKDYKAKLSKEEQALLKNLAYASFLNRYFQIGTKETQMAIRASIKELKNRNKFKKVK